MRSYIHMLVRAYQAHSRSQTYHKLATIWTAKHFSQSLCRRNSTPSSNRNCLHSTRNLHDTSLTKLCICGLAKCVENKCPYVHGSSWNSIGSNESILAPYVGSHWEYIDVMLDVANLSETDRIVDLGAGDGRVLIRAIQRGAHYAEGWEMDEDVFELGQLHIQGVFVEQRSCLERCVLRFGDVTSQPVAHMATFNIITLFLLPSGLKILEPYLRQVMQAASTATLDKGASESRLRVVCQGWPIAGWLPTAVKQTLGGTVIYLYTAQSITQ